MKAVGIIWDVDYEEDLELLPKEIEIPDWMTDEERFQITYPTQQDIATKGSISKSKEVMEAATDMTKKHGTALLYR